MSRYIIWDHVSTVITPSGEIFTPQEWDERYPAATLIPYVMSGGDMNGALMQSYGSMKEMAIAQGCDLTGITDGQPVLDAIEAFEIEREQQAFEDEQAQREAEIAEAQAAAELAQREVEALEDLVVMNMPDVGE